MIELLKNGIDSQMIELKGSEKEIQRSVKNYLVANDFEIISENYVQEKQRVKNLGSAEPDLILEKDDIKFIIEIKLQPDSDRGSSRFQRGIIDILYLGKEVINKEKLRGLLFYVDRQNTGYLTKNFFLNSIKDIVRFNIPDKLIWHKDKFTQSSYTVIEVFK